MPKLSKVLFCLKTIPFFLLLVTLFNPAQAQVPDTVYTKPELNQGLPPAVPTRPVIVTPPAKPKPVNEDSLKQVNKMARQNAARVQPEIPYRFYTGGSFQLGFGNYTFIQVAPVLAYRINSRLTVGSGLSYIYISDPFDAFHIWGGKVFGQVTVYKAFFGHLEYEMLDFQSPFPVILAGAGYRSMFSERFGVDTMLLLDVNNNENSYYRNPIIRATFIYNF